MLGFVGFFEHTLDEKGRLILPARFRAEFGAKAHLTHFFEGCVAVWTTSEFDRQKREVLAHAKENTADARNHMRVWSWGTSDVDVDRQGRFVVPAKSREYAGLAGEVVILGAIDHLEIWNPNWYAERVQPAEQYFSGSGLAP